MPHLKIMWPGLLIKYKHHFRFMEFVYFGVPFQTYMLVVAGFILSFYDEWQKVCLFVVELA